MATAVLPRWRCRYHAERPGVGVCTTCSATLCEECATRVEGILHCRVCLARTARGPRRPRWRSLPALLPALGLGLVTWTLLGYGFYGLVALLAFLVERALA